jgi:hypothetical protein
MTSGCPACAGIRNRHQRLIDSYRKAHAARVKTGGSERCEKS